MGSDGRVRRLGLAVTILVLAATASGCTQVEDTMASVPFLNFMREAPSFDPYEAPRPAPQNSVPLSSPAGDWEPTLEQPVSEVALQAFGDTLTNPLPRNETVLARGNEVYQTYCMVCHGAQGEGNGPVVDPAAGKFPMGPDLRLSTTVARSDGYIYAIVKAGRGLMPSYRRIPPQDRWAVVTYVRELQGQGGAAGASGQPAPSADTPDTPDSGAAADDAAGTQGQD